MIAVRKLTHNEMDDWSYTYIFVHDDSVHLTF
jgi:hypothetical protein